MGKQVPNPLYKYQSFSNEKHFSNLEKSVLYFSRPNLFNDPFDCHLPLILPEPSEKDWKACYKSLGNLKDVPEDKYVRKGKTTNDFQKMVRERVREFWFTRMSEVDRAGIACFSTKFDDILMWSHYGDRHSGMCIEFDTSFAPFQRAHKVSYSCQQPTINAAKVITQSNVLPFLSLFKTKSKRYSYECEWRIFDFKGDQEIPFDRRAITKIYFGVNTKLADMQKVVELFKSSGTCFFQMIRTVHEFKLDFGSCPSINGKIVGII